MDFGDALKAMRAGHRVSRAGWAAPRNWWVYIQAPSEGSDVQWPYLVKHWTDGTVPWVPTHADLLATDWEITGDGE